MREIHQGLPFRDFPRPSSGIIDVTVCAKSGLLRTPACNEGEVTLPFLEGTQPTQYCTIHGEASYAETAIGSMRTGILGLDEENLLGSLTLPVLDPELFPELQRSAAGGSASRNSTRRSGSQPNQNRNTNQGSRNTFRNPFLDGDFNSSSGGDYPWESPSLSSDENLENDVTPDVSGEPPKEEFSLPPLYSGEDFNPFLD
jgi:hypothetical protein